MTAQQTSFVTAALAERCADNFTHTCLERKVCRLIYQLGLHCCVWVFRQCTPHCKAYRWHKTPVPRT